MAAHADAEKAEIHQRDGPDKYRQPDDVNRLNDGKQPGLLDELCHGLSRLEVLTSRTTSGNPRGARHKRIRKRIRLPDEAGTSSTESPRGSPTRWDLPL